MKFIFWNSFVLWRWLITVRPQSTFPRFSSERKTSPTSVGLPSIFIGKKEKSDLSRPSLDFHRKERQVRPLSAFAWSSSGRHAQKSPIWVGFPSIFIEKKDKSDLGRPSLDLHRKAIKVQPQSVFPRSSSGSNKRSISISLPSIFIKKQLKPDLSQTSLDLHREATKARPQSAFPRSSSKRYFQKSLTTVVKEKDYPRT